MNPGTGWLPDSAYRAAFRRRLRSVPIDEGTRFPWRASTNPYVVLLAEILLQRTRGPNVATNFRKILRRIPNPTRLANTPVAELERLIGPLGLRKRAPTLKQLGEVLVARFSSSIPDVEQDLRELPGVGPYGASAVKSFAFNQRAAIVDTGIARVLRRCLGLPADRRVNQDHQLWLIAESLLPRTGHRRHNLALLTVADELCLPEPRCQACPLLKVCDYGTLKLSAAKD